MEWTLLIRLLTFAAALILGMMLVKVTVQHIRDKEGLDSINPRTTYIALASYACLIFYVAAVQTLDNFSSPITWRTAVGQMGVLLGAAAGLRDYILIDLPALRARRAKKRRKARL